MLKNCLQILKQQNVNYSVAKLKEKPRIRQWATHSYGDIQDLELISSRVPFISNPDEVQIEVQAASVNPIDLMMLKGYGRTLISIPRRETIEFPLTFGRDFSGVVVGKGHNVGDRFKLGDEVYGFIPLHKQGSFREIITVDKTYIQKAPKDLTAIESASLVYVSMTAWSALFIFANLCFKNRENLRILVLGGSGGVGTAAIQILKSQKCTVFTSCSSNAMDLVTKLGADVVYDYNDPDYLKNVASEKYHVILDCAQFGVNNVPQDWLYDQYVTLNSPLLVNTDQYGVIGGLAESAKTLIQTNLSKNGKLWKWAFIVPSGDGFQFLDKLIKDGKLKPVIHKEVPFENLPDAFETVKGGHLRGKVVVKF